MNDNNSSILERLKQYEIAFKLDFEKIQKLQEKNKKLLEENNILKNNLKIYTLNNNISNE